MIISFVNNPAECDNEWHYRIIIIDARFNAWVEHYAAGKCSRWLYFARAAHINTQFNAGLISVI